MTSGGKGITALIAACTIWGLSPLYYKLIDHIAPLQVLAHRTLWSALFFAGVLVLQGQARAIPKTIASGAFLRILLAALAISANWFLFIYSVHAGKATESSLGYYIFPLVAVLLGRAVFSEPLGRGQWLAVALAAAGVTVLTMGLGVPPWIALIIASTFGFYGVIKKGLDAGPVVSVTCEVLLLVPIALALLAWYRGTGQAVFGPGNLRDSLLLVGSGPITAGPLILFTIATRRVTLATVGLVQFMNPTLQFFSATVILGEPFGPWHLAAFVLIWTAVAVYSASSLRSGRAARSTASSAVVSGTTVTKPASEASAKP